MFKWNTIFGSKIWYYFWIYYYFHPLKIIVCIINYLKRITFILPRGNVSHIKYVHLFRTINPTVHNGCPIFSSFRITTLQNGYLSLFNIPRSSQIWRRICFCYRPAFPSVRRTHIPLSTFHFLQLELLGWNSWSYDTDSSTLDLIFSSVKMGAR